MVCMKLSKLISFDSTLSLYELIMYIGVARDNFILYNILITYILQYSHYMRKKIYFRAHFYIFTFKVVLPC